MNLSSSRTPIRHRRTAHEREERRIRIMAMVRSGFSYEAIAREHQLTRTRIRQIVAASAPTERSGAQVDQMRVRMARPEPALRLAERGVEKGQLRAIGPLLRVLDRLDRYAAIAEPQPPCDENPREKQLAKLDRAAARSGIREVNVASRPIGACAAGARRRRGETQVPSPCVVSRSSIS